MRSFALLLVLTASLHYGTTGLGDEQGEADKPKSAEQSADTRNALLAQRERLGKQATALDNLKRPRQAIERAEKKLALERQLFGERSAAALETTKWIADRWHKLGKALRESGKLQDAVEPFEKATHGFETLSLTLDAARAYRELGDCQRDLGTLEKAADAYANSFALFAQCEHEDDLALQHWYYGKTLFDLGRYDKAVVQFDGAAEGFDAAGKSILCARMHSWKGSSYQEMQRTKDAVNSFADAIKAYGDTGLSQDEEALNTLGSYVEALLTVGEYEQSIRQNKQLLALCEGKNRPLFAIVTRSLLGDAYRLSLDTAKAAAAYQDVVREFSAWRDVVGEQVVRQYPGSLFHVGRALHYGDRENDAIPYFTEAAASYEQADQMFDAANMYDRIGDCHWDAGRKEDAIAAYRECVRRHRLLPPGTQLTEMTAKLANGLSEQGDPTGAKQAYSELLAHSTDKNFLHGIAIANEGLASTAFFENRPGDELKHRAQAEAALRQLLTTRSEPTMDLKWRLSSAVLALANAESALGQYGKALPLAEEAFSRLEEHGPNALPKRMYAADTVRSSLVQLGRNEKAARWAKTILDMTNDFAKRYDAETEKAKGEAPYTIFKTRAEAALTLGNSAVALRSAKRAQSLIPSLHPALQAFAPFNIRFILDAADPNGRAMREGQVQSDNKLASGELQRTFASMNRLMRVLNQFQTLRQQPGWESLPVDQVIGLSREVTEAARELYETPFARQSEYAWSVPFMEATLAWLEGDMPLSRAKAIAALNELERIKEQVGGTDADQFLYHLARVAEFGTPAHLLSAIELKAGNTRGALQYAERAKASVLLRMLARGEQDTASVLAMLKEHAANDGDQTLLEQLAGIEQELVASNTRTDASASLRRKLLTLRRSRLGVKLEQLDSARLQTLIRPGELLILFDAVREMEAISFDDALHLYVVPPPGEDIQHFVLSRRMISDGEHELPKDGALVHAVLPDSNAEKAGLRPYDVITRYDGQNVNQQNLVQVVSGVLPEDSVPIVFQRANRKFVETTASGRLGVVFSQQPLHDAWRDDSQQTISSLSRDVSRYIESIEAEARSDRRGLEQLPDDGEPTERKTKLLRSKADAHLGHILFRSLVPDEVWSRIRKSKLVYVIRDGSLNRLPFETLIVRQPTTSSSVKERVYWIDEGPPIVYGPSIAVLQNRREARDRQLNRAGDETPEKIVALGDPQFSSDRSDRQQLPSEESESQSRARRITREVRETYKKVGLRQLPGTRREVVAIYKTVMGEPLGERAVPASRQNQAWVQPLLGEDANETALFEAAQGARFLHLATHGLVYETEEVSRSSLALTETRELSSTDDGFLTLADLLHRWGSRLRDTELVVLSACDSQNGLAGGSEGVFGLPWGFMYAGTPAVVASLWQVDDDSTAKLFGEYYKEILSPNSPSDLGKLRAFVEVRKRLRKEYPHPYHWGPFIYLGDPR